MSTVGVPKTDLLNAPAPPPATAPRNIHHRPLLLQLHADYGAVVTAVAAAAIVRRVALVVLAGVALGTALFFIGLETLFPKY